MLSIFKWLKSVWIWLGYFFVFPHLDQSSKRDHDSDGTDDEKDEVRSPQQSEPGVYDETDKVANDTRMRQEVVGSHEQKSNPKSSPKSEIVRIKNPYCVVIVNVNFQHLVEARNGATADRENIRNFLEQTAGFKTIKMYDDVTRKKTLEIMDEISNSAEVGNHDGLMVFISTHGKQKGILTVDKKIVEIQEMTSRVNGKQCERLRGKPKLFFISACRGRKSDPGVPGPVVADSPLDEKVVPKLPTDADFLICYSTTEGYISHRRYGLGIQSFEGMGTWFICQLTEVFKQSLQNEDVMQMLARVNGCVASMSSGGDHVDGMKQMPVQMHMLRHRVFLGRKSVTSSLT